MNQKTIKASSADNVMKIEVISADSRKYSISNMCKILKIYRQTYYNYLKKSQEENHIDYELEMIKDLIIHYHTESRGSYGPEV